MEFPLNEPQSFRAYFSSALVALIFAERIETMTGTYALASPLHNRAGWVVTW